MERELSEESIKEGKEEKPTFLCSENKSRGVSKQKRQQSRGQAMGSTSNYGGGGGGGGGGERVEEEEEEEEAEERETADGLESMALSGLRFMLYTL
ncbi:hypothetical protein NL676_038352 [Syzygium grande]|nr:hypothetical protein NL676_038352 [Syzygium grande]